MDLDDFASLATTLDGVRRRVVDGQASWRLGGRVVARELDEEHVVIRCDFEYRDELLGAFPGTFSVPRRFEQHMMIVADLAGGDPGAIEDALEAAWLLQRRD
jgi:hypothetical protein